MGAVMGAAAVGLVAEGGGGAAAIGGSEAGMLSKAGQFFGKDSASASKLTDFASEKGMSPQQFSNIFHKAFGNNPGEPQGPEHHKDPVQSFINLFNNLAQLAEHIQALSEKKSQLPSPMSSMKPQPTATPNADEDKKQEQEATSRRASMSPRPGGRG